MNEFKFLLSVTKNNGRCSYSMRKYTVSAANFCSVECPIRNRLMGHSCTWNEAEEIAKEILLEKYRERYAEELL